MISGNESQNIPCDAPEINMSNSNAIAILKIISNGTIARDDLYYGTWEKSELPSIAQRLIWLLNTNSDAESVCKTPFIQESLTGPTVYYSGRSIEYIRTRLEQIQTMVIYASENNFSICWC